METKPATSRVGWRVAAAAVRGKGHEKSGQPCQDSVAWHEVPGMGLIAAVADGAGSAKLGEIGSEIAARSALAFLENPDKDAEVWHGETGAKAQLKAALEAALKAVTAEAATRQVKPGDLATTLLVCVATRERLAAAQVGDGAVVFAKPDGSFTALTRPVAGEYLNETVFLTSEGALERAQIESWSGCARELALFSDGLQMLALKMPEGTPHAPFFKPLFAWLEKLGDGAAGGAHLEAFLRSPRVAERTDDDLTLLLARRGG
jgi:hypothetical protein